MNRRRIMVIDSEEIIRDMAKISLEVDGYAVETFLNGESALARMRSQRFDVVVTDYQMEDIDGVEVLRSVKRDHPGTTVIMMSAHPELKNVPEVLRGELHEFFLKPLNIRSLKASIHRALIGAGDRARTDLGM